MFKHIYSLLDCDCSNSSDVLFKNKKAIFDKKPQGLVHYNVINYFRKTKKLNCPRTKNDQALGKIK